MPKKDRAKPRSGKYRSERHFSTPEIEAALRVERVGGTASVSADALAARRYVAEALGIVDEIYRRHGLAPFPGATDQLFASYDGSNGWVTYDPPRTREDAAQSLERSPSFELQPWWALGYAEFGHDSEPGFASDIAAAIPAVGDERTGRWMRAFHVGYRLSTAVGRWRVEYEMRREINVRQVANAEEGARQTRDVRKKRQAAKHRKWQALANPYWKRNPEASNVEVARHVLKQLPKGKRFAGALNTIRQVIKRPR